MHFSFSFFLSHLQEVFDGHPEAGRVAQPEPLHVVAAAPRRRGRQVCTPLAHGPAAYAAAAASRGGGGGGGPCAAADVEGEVDERGRGLVPPRRAVGPLAAEKTAAPRVPDPHQPELLELEDPHHRVQHCKLHALVGAAFLHRSRSRSGPGAPHHVAAEPPGVVRPRDEPLPQRVPRRAERRARGLKLFGRHVVALDGGAGQVPQSVLDRARN